MTKLLDRQLIYSYIKSYVICLSSLLALFIVVDLFTNLDGFAEHHSGLVNLLEFIGTYYASKTPMIFDRLSEAIVLLAAMFTVAWMQRNNEILPLLSAGVSTRRVVRPVLFAAFGMVTLASLNQELLLPQIDPYLVELRADAAVEKEMEVKGGYESNEIHISGNRAYQKDQVIKDFTVVFPNKPGFEGLPTLQAKTARYRPAGDGRDRGGWELTEARPETLPGFNKKEILEQIVPGKYFLYTSQIDFRTATRPKNWATFIPTYELPQEMGKVDHNKLAALAVVFHVRLTRPILGMLLVFMGLSTILRDQNRNVFISAGLCLLLCATFFIVGFFCKYLGDHSYLHPAMAAWAPVFIFGPLSFVMFDAVHT